MDGLYSEIATLSTTVARTRRLNGDVEATQRSAADTVAVRIDALHAFTLHDNEAFLEALEDATLAFGEEGTKKLVALANNKAMSPSPAAKRGKHGMYEEKTQKLPTMGILGMMTSNDWATIKSRSYSVQYKMGVIQSRLNRWGFKHLAENSRIGPISVLLSQHYGRDLIGTTECSYKNIYEKQNDLAQAIMQNARSDTPDPDGFRLKFPDDASTLPQELQDFACPDADDPRVAMDLDDFQQCAEHVVLRKTNAKLVAELRRGGPFPVGGHVGTMAITDGTDAASLGRGRTMVVTSDDLQRFIDRGRESTRSSWEVAPERQRPALQDERASGNDAPNTRSPDSHTTVSKGLTSPKVRTFGTLSERSERVNAPPPTKSSVHDRDASGGDKGAAWDSNDGWKPNGTWDGDGAAWWRSSERMWDDAAEDPASKPQWGKHDGWTEPRDAPTDNPDEPWPSASSAASKGSWGVADYEQKTKEALARAKNTKGQQKLLDAKAALAATSQSKMKRPAAATSVVKAARAAVGKVGKPAVAKAARAASGAVNSKYGKWWGTINIREICTKAVAKSCSRDAFMRRGWDIGDKLADAKGVDAGARTQMRAVGYAKAKEYFESL
jgi:hypothetical protein